MNFQGIEAITFDAGGTLIDPWPSVGEIYASVAANLGFANLSADVLNRQFATAWKQKQNFDYSRAAWLHLVEATFSDLLRISPKLFDALYERFAQPDVWRVYDDVRPALQALRERDFRLGVISNWDDRLGPLLERLNLSACLDVVILSVHAGATKPSPLIFQQAARALELPPESILHIGDSFGEDVGGAKAAGFNALLLNREQATQSDEVIASLSAIPELVE